MSITSVNLNDLNELNNTINDIVNNVLSNEFNIDISNYKELISIKHSTFNYLMSKVYNSLFNPNFNLEYNKKTIIDYEDLNVLNNLLCVYIGLTQRLNKSVGLYGFGYMVGVPSQTLSEWVSEEGRKLNPQRWELLRKAQEDHKAQHISLLNDSGLGLIAVANNDNETGLNWAEKQQQATTTKEVYFLPSERIERLRIETEQKSGEHDNKV